MEITIGNYKLKNDVEIKIIPDGYEIYSKAIKKYKIKIENFKSAYWIEENIIVEEV